MNDAFAHLIGHDRIVKRLRIMIARGALPQALVFSGPKHVGKTTLAMSVAAALLETGQPDRHPDFRLIGRPRDEKTGKLKKQIPIDAIRELQDGLRLSAFLGGAKIAVIAGADHLSEEAANGLLKILEEPPPRTHLILCAEELAKLPKTILSRTAVFICGRVAARILAEGLKASGKNAYDREKICVMADGLPGLAISFLEDEAMVKWHEAETGRWQMLRGAPIHRRLAECAAMAPQKSDREETVERLREALSVWQSLLRRELKAGEPAVSAQLRRLLSLQVSLGINVQPRSLLEKFVLGLER